MSRELLREGWTIEQCRQIGLAVEMGQKARRERDAATLRAGGSVSEAPNYLTPRVRRIMNWAAIRDRKKRKKGRGEIIRAFAGACPVPELSRYVASIKAVIQPSGAVNLRDLWEEFWRLMPIRQAEWRFRPWEHPECYQRERGSVREVEAPKCARCLICKTLIKRRSLCGWIPGRARDYVHLSCYDRFPGGWSPPEVKRRANGRKRLAEERKKVLGYFERPPKLERAKRSEV